MKVFDYVVFYAPKEDAKDEGGSKEVAKIVIEGRMIEGDIDIAKMKVTRLIPVEYDNKLADLNIAIRPF